MMMATSKTGKRPLRSLSAHEKLEAIRRVHDGESKASVARDIGVPESTLRGWCKNEGKITYLSRQSSPETDEQSLEPKEKRSKIEDAMVQPFNLSLKSSNTYTPNSESLYTPVDYSKSDMMDATPKTPQNLSIKTETPKSTASQMTERERNRAELARLSIELGLNRPEMFTAANSTNITTTSTPSTSNLADIATNLNLLTQWNNLVMQQQLLNGGQSGCSSSSNNNNNNNNNNKKVAAAAADTTTNLLPASKSKLPKEQQSVEEYVKCWLRAQEVLLATQQARSPSTTSQQLPGTTTTTTNSLPPSSTSSNYHSSWFWQWYKQLSYQQSALAAASTPEKPILYQQLTKENNNIDNTQLNDNTLLKNINNNNNNSNQQNNNNNNNKVKSVLDNLFVNNNNNINNNNENKTSDENKEEPSADDNNLSQSEALEHGEKFMKWLESCSDPSVTAMQIMQFKTLLNNLKNGADRRNGDMRLNKTKVKRK